MPSRGRASEDRSYVPFVMWHETRQMSYIMVRVYALVWCILELVHECGARADGRCARPSRDVSWGVGRATWRLAAACQVLVGPLTFHVAGADGPLQLRLVL